jgi:hypothetical protein
MAVPAKGTAILIFNTNSKFSTANPLRNIPQPPPMQIVTYSSNDGDQRGLWVDKGCRADFSVRY